MSVIVRALVGAGAGAAIGIIPAGAAYAMETMTGHATPEEVATCQQFLGQTAVHNATVPIGCHDIATYFKPEGDRVELPAAADLQGRVRTVDTAERTKALKWEIGSPTALGLASAGLFVWRGRQTSYLSRLPSRSGPVGAKR